MKYDFDDDIAMCSTNRCERREQCYRYMKKPNGIQTYANFEVVCCDNESYQFFMEIENKLYKK